MQEDACAGRITHRAHTVGGGAGWPVAAMRQRSPHMFAQRRTGRCRRYRSAKRLAVMTRRRALAAHGGRCELLRPSWNENRTAAARPTLRQQSVAAWSVSSVAFVKKRGSHTFLSHTVGYAFPLILPPRSCVGFPSIKLPPLWLFRRRRCLLPYVGNIHASTNSIDNRQNIVRLVRLLLAYCPRAADGFVNAIVLCDAVTRLTRFYCRPFCFDDHDFPTPIELYFQGPVSLGQLFGICGSIVVRAFSGHDIR